MAIATYSDLQTAIGTWMSRSGDAKITGNAADIVTLAESRLNRTLPLNVNRIDVTLTGAVGSRSLTLPSDFYEPISLKLTTFGVETLLRPMIFGLKVNNSFNGVPDAWGINGTNIDLDTPCNQAHIFLFRYRKAFALSNSATTNWLLTNHPDVYLQACLVEAEFLVKDWNSAQMRQGRLQSTIEEILEKDSRLLSVGSLTVDNALATPHGFDITSGY